MSRWFSGTPQVVALHPGAVPATSGPVHHPERTEARRDPGLVLEPADTLDGVFRRRVEATPRALAYRQFDPRQQRWVSTSWREMATEVARWQAGLLRLGLEPGARVAVMLKNSREWVAFDQAALGLGLVTVPLYTSDRPDNIAWILRDSGASALVIGGAAQWERLQPIRATIDRLALLLSVEPFTVAARTRPPANLRWLHEWLPARAEETAAFVAPTHADAMATLVYTSGTTGRPKGVMLSHRNILFNVDAGLRAVPVYPEDRMLSFLPLSHTLERSIGYYLSMVAGSEIAFARSIPQLAEDLACIRPTLMIAVPRIFERVHARVLETLAEAPPTRRRLFEQAVDRGWEAFLHAQGRAPWSARQLLAPALDRLVGAKIRARMGGRLRVAISGGAPLPGEVSRFFIGLGVTVLQGYGLTETSPVIAVNRQEDNEPTSVGPALTGVEVRTDAAGELLTRSPSVMQGYWNRPEATRVMIDVDGWLHTGDLATIGPRGHVTITGRKKEILVLSTGEKVPPADLEQALGRSPWVNQILVAGDGLPALCALAVRSEALHEALAQPGHPLYQASEETEQQFVLEDLRARLEGFPGYARLAGVALTDTPWTEENGLLTPTLKLKRGPILARHTALLEKVEEQVAGVSH